MNYSVEIFKTATGKMPFKKWINDLADMRARVAIEMRIDRLSLGNLGQSKSLGGGLHELKVDVGPGYRVYFGRVGQQVILLLCAGDKKSQQKDIDKAREYLEDYKMRG
ncbi:MAG: type II toxin-antitoxin system RelE/ParE family toxin [Candidatus Babeliales bacterium]